MHVHTMACHAHSTRCTTRSWSAMAWPTTPKSYIAYARQRASHLAWVPWHACCHGTRHNTAYVGVYGPWGSHAYVCVQCVMFVRSAEGVPYDLELDGNVAGQRTQVEQRRGRRRWHDRAEVRMHAPVHATGGMARGRLSVCVCRHVCVPHTVWCCATLGMISLPAHACAPERASSATACPVYSLTTSDAQLNASLAAKHTEWACMHLRAGTHWHQRRKFLQPICLRMAKRSDTNP